MPAQRGPPDSIKEKSFNPNTRAWSRSPLSNLKPHVLLDPVLGPDWTQSGRGRLTCCICSLLDRIQLDLPPPHQYFPMVMDVHPKFQCMLLRRKYPAPTQQLALCSWEGITPVLWGIHEDNTSCDRDAAITVTCWRGGHQQHWQPSHSEWYPIRGPQIITGGAESSIPSPDTTCIKSTQISTFKRVSLKPEEKQWRQEKGEKGCYMLKRLRIKPPSKDREDILSAPPKHQYPLSDTFQV